MRQKFFAWSVSKVDGIITISQAEAGALRKRFPHLAEKIEFIHEATDLAFFKPQPESAQGNKVISVGMYGRDFDTLIKASEGLDVECVLATKLISEDQAKHLPRNITVGVYDHVTLRKKWQRQRLRT